MTPGNVGFVVMLAIYVGLAMPASGFAVESNDHPDLSPDDPRNMLLTIFMEVGRK